MASYMTTSGQHFHGLPYIGLGRLTKYGSNTKSKVMAINLNALYSYKYYFAMLET